MPIDHFGWLAPHYEKIFRPRFDQSWSRLLSLPARGSLLDIGGGTGRLSQFFSSEVNRVMIIDESAGMLRQARLKEGLIPLCGCAESLPFRDDSIERVMMIDALHHLEDQHLAVKEMVRVLKPGGRLLIEEPDIRNLWVKMIALGEKALQMRSRFLGGEAILELFRGMPARTHLERNAGILWVTAEKLP